MLIEKSSPEGFARYSLVFVSSSNSDGLMESFRHEEGRLYLMQTFDRLGCSMALGVTVLPVSQGGLRVSMLFKVIPNLIVERCEKDRGNSPRLTNQDRVVRYAMGDYGLLRGTAGC